MVSLVRTMTYEQSRMKNQLWWHTYNLCKWRIADRDKVSRVQACHVGIVASFNIKIEGDEYRTNCTSSAFEVDYAICSCSAPRAQRLALS